MSVYTIGEVSKMTGLSAHTLRYYEKLGLIPSPTRETSGNRRYTSSDIHFIRFLYQLKQTGMSLDEMKDFVGDGCLVQQMEEGKSIAEAVEKRIDLLNKHLDYLREQQEQIQQIYTYTQNKLSYYHQILDTESKSKSAT